LGSESLDSVGSGNVKTQKLLFYNLIFYYIYKTNINHAIFYREI